MRQEKQEKIKLQGNAKRGKKSKKRSNYKVKQKKKKKRKENYKGNFVRPLGIEQYTNRKTTF